MKMIVVVEDQQVLATAYSNKFRGEGFNVEVAMDGEAGLNKPIVIYSTAALFSDQQEGIKAGATAYLVKPEDLFNVGQIASDLLIKQPATPYIRAA